MDARRGSTDPAASRSCSCLWFVRGGLITQFGASSDEPRLPPGAILPFNFPRV